MLQPEADNNTTKRYIVDIVLRFHQLFEGNVSLIIVRRVVIG